MRWRVMSRHMHGNFATPLQPHCKAVGRSVTAAAVNRPTPSAARGTSRSLEPLSPYPTRPPPSRRSSEP